MAPLKTFDRSDSHGASAATGIAHGIAISLVAWLVFADLWLLLH